MPSLAVVAVLSFCGSTVLVGITRRLLVGWKVMDVPNARSSHRDPIPRGGGISIVLTFSAISFWMWSTGRLPTQFFLAFFVGGLAVAAVGLIDDCRGLSVRVRFAVHAGAALFAVVVIGNLPTIRVGNHFLHPGWLGYIVETLGIIWSLNLFNFMDGLDGIAGSQAAFMCFAWIVIGSAVSGAAGAGWLCAALGSACAGFLLWNWPPARVFMGDVGSGYTGYTLAILALAAARASDIAIWIWLILGGFFFVDATLTLALRFARGEQVHDSHRSHAYQRLSDRWRSHRRVTLAVLLLNLAWLFPNAWIAARHPPWAPWLTLTSLALVSVVVVVAGAGTAAPATDSGLRG